MARNKTKLRFPRTKQFTIADCIALNESLNAQTVRTLIRRAIAIREVSIVGRATPVGRGRPAFYLARA